MKYSPSQKKRTYIALVFSALLVFGGGLAAHSAQAAFGDSKKVLGKSVAGDGAYRTNAYFDFPEDIASDGYGNFYIADTQNHSIRKIDKNGIVSKIAGRGGYGDRDGTASKAMFASPYGVAVSRDGVVYVADTGNNKIKKVENGRVETIASGIRSPRGIFIRNNKLYVTEAGRNALFSMDTNGNNVRYITQSLNNPRKLYVRGAGDFAYITNAGSATVERVNLTSGNRTVVAGKRNATGQTLGDCTNARFNNISGVTVVEGSAATSDTLYITDGENYFDDSSSNVGDIDYIDSGSIKRINQSPSACTVELLVEDDFDYNITSAAAIVRYGDSVYVAIAGTSEIARLRFNDIHNLRVWAGKDRYHNTDGSKSSALPGRPKALALNKSGRVMYVAENNQIKKYNFKTKLYSYVVGNTVDNYQKNDNRDFIGTEARFSDITAIALNPKTKLLYVVDRNNNRIREVSPQDNAVRYFTGAGNVNMGGGQSNGYREGGPCANEFDTGVSGCAYFSRPAGLAIDPNGEYAYVADTENHVIRRVKLTAPNKGTTSLVAGKPTVAGYQDGYGDGARFHTPMGLSLNAKGTRLFVADRDNHAIRKIDLTNGKVTTAAGNPERVGYLDGKAKKAYLNLPVSVHFANRVVFFTESGTNRVRALDLRVKAVKLISGSGDRGKKNGTRDEAQYDDPFAVVYKNDRVFVADRRNDMIRKVEVGDITNIPYTEPGPGVTSVDPSVNIVAGSRGDTKALRIVGGAFQHGARVFFGSHEANQVFVNSDRELSVVIPFGELEPGYYQVKVVNVDGQKGYMLRGYAVANPDGSVPVRDFWAD